MNNNTKKYLKKIRAAFPVFHKNERRFLNDIKVTLSNFEEENPECNMVELTNNFGDPKEIVVDYFNNMDTSQYLHLMRKSFYVKVSTITILILFVIFFFYQTFSLYQLNQQTKEDMIATEKTIIIQDN